MNKRQVLLASAALVAAGLGMAFALIAGSPTRMPVYASATVLGHPRAIPAFGLRDHHDQVFDGADLRGHWNLLFFGFTHCPDICPTTLTTVARAMRTLGDLPARQRPRVWLVSVDPVRDDAQRLSSYVEHFDPAFGALTGDAAALADFAAGLGAAYTVTPAQGAGDYDIAHTAALFVTDPQGRLAAIFTPPHKAADIAADLRAIVSGP